MATAIKRQCGTVLTALGASVSTVLALVQLQKSKTLAVLADLTELLQGRMQAAQWRRVWGSFNTSTSLSEWTTRTLMACDARLLLAKSCPEAWRQLFGALRSSSTTPSAGWQASLLWQERE